MEEQWKELEEHKDYKISNEGRVVNKHNVEVYKNNNRVNLKINNKLKSFRKEKLKHKYFVDITINFSNKIYKEDILEINKDNYFKIEKIKRFIKSIEYNITKNGNTVQLNTYNNLFNLVNLNMNIDVTDVEIRTALYSLYEKN